MRPSKRVRREVPRSQHRPRGAGCLKCLFGCEVPFPNPHRWVNQNCSTGYQDNVPYPCLTSSLEDWRGNPGQFLFGAEDNERAVHTLERPWQGLGLGEIASDDLSPALDVGD